MRTTLDIADSILREARSLAARKRTTLKAVVEQALRDSLARERHAALVAKVQTRTFGGNGLQAGLSWDDWGAIRTLVNAELVIARALLSCALRVPACGQDSPEIVVGDSVAPFGLAVGEAAIYFTDRSTGAVRREPK